MGELWGRRAFRHLVIGTTPLVVVALTLLVVLALRFAQVAEPVREATGTAQATVVRSGLGADRREVELRWTDGEGVQRVSRVRAPRARNVPQGATVTLHYVPNDPSRVYVPGDETSIRLRRLATNQFLLAVLLAAVLLITGVHIARRLRAERRPGTTLPVSYSRSKRGLVRRAWLVINDTGRDWWVPAHWDPVLLTLLAETPCTVHGRPSQASVVVVDVAGTPIWQAGRRRPLRPRGADEVSAARWSKAAQRRADAEAQRTGEGRMSLARQIREDAALLTAAPLLGLLWSYFDGSGLAGFVGSTLVFAALLFWLPAISGSDPT